MSDGRVSRATVQHELLDLVDAATALKLSDGGARAYELAQLIDDVDVLQRMAAALATVVAFDLVSSPRPRAASLMSYRGRLARWVDKQRLDVEIQRFEASFGDEP